MSGSPEIRLNVRDLIVRPQTPQDDWRVLGAGGIARAQLGTQIHSYYLNEKSGVNYQKEVVLVHTFPWTMKGLKRRRPEKNGSGKEYNIKLQGRLDGVYETPEGAVVEEIKSTHLGGAALLETEADPSHIEQCALYCLLLEYTGRKVVGGEVVYISFTDGRIHHFDIAYKREQYQALLDERLGEIIQNIEEEERLARYRARAAETLQFPFETIRPTQQTFLQDLAGVARAGGALLCSAPTGTGKTAAALFPMTKEAFLKNGKVFFVTARVSQQELALKTMAEILPRNGYGMAMQLRSKERSCPMEEMRCIKGLCPYLNDFAEKIEANALLDISGGAGALDADQITAEAVQAEVCPFELSLQLAGRAQVIISDFNYVFDPHSYLRRFFDKPNRPLYLVVDEAHNLPERNRTYYSPEIEIKHVTECLKQLRPHTREGLLDFGDGDRRSVIQRCEEILRELKEWWQKSLKRLEEERGESPNYVVAPEREFIERLHVLLEDLIGDYNIYQLSRGENPAIFERVRRENSRRYRDPLLELLYNIKDFVEYGRPEAGGGVFNDGLFCVVFNTVDEKLKLVCRDGSAYLARRASIFHATLFMSATLTPFDFFIRQLGQDPRRCLTLELPSPFPPQNRLFLTVPTVDTTYERRSEFAGEIARIIIESVDERAGNYLVFFSSFAFRDQVVASFPTRPYQIIKQEPAMPTEIVLKLLRMNRNKTMILCAVHGGVFAEGVDFPDHLALGAFIVGPGLPPVEIERELIREYYNDIGLDGFEYASIFPAMNRVVQAGGRVIRKETDRGFVMLLGRRFADERYREKLPGFWRDELSAVNEPGKILQEFWSADF